MGILIVFILYQKDPIIAIFIFIIIAIMIFIFLMLIGAEFMALLISIIYAGVIIVLFLFTVIIYDLKKIDFEIPVLTFKNIFCFGYEKDPYYIHIISIFLVYKSIRQIWGPLPSFSEFGGSKLKHFHEWSLNIIELPSFAGYTIDILQLSCLFNKHGVLFLACGLLLFIAIIGSVVMTHSFVKLHSH